MSCPQVNLSLKEIDKEIQVNKCPLPHQLPPENFIIIIIIIVIYWALYISPRAISLLMKKATEEAPLVL